MKAYKMIGVLVVALVLAVGGLFLVLGPVTTTGAQVPDSAPTPTPPDTSRAAAPVQPGGIADPDALTDVGIGLESLAQIVGPPLIPPPDIPGYYAPLPAGVTQVTAAGPVAYLAKEEAPETIVEAVRRASRGEVFFSGEQRARARHWHEEVGERALGEFDRARTQGATVAGRGAG